MKSPGQETYEGTEGKSTESSKHIGSFINSTIGCNWHLITKNENVQYRQAGRSGIPVKKVDTNNTTSTQCTTVEFYYNIRPQSLQFQFHKILSQGPVSINTMVRI